MSTNASGLFSARILTRDQAYLLSAAVVQAALDCPFRTEPLLHYRKPWFDLECKIWHYEKKNTWESLWAYFKQLLTTRQGARFVIQP